MLKPRTPTPKASSMLGEALEAAVAGLARAVHDELGTPPSSAERAVATSLGSASPQELSRMALVATSRAMDKRLVPLIEPGMDTDLAEKLARALRCTPEQASRVVNGFREASCASA